MGGARHPVQNRYEREIAIDEHDSVFLPAQLALPLVFLKSSSGLRILSWVGTFHLSKAVISFHRRSTYLIPSAYNAAQYETTGKDVEDSVDPNGEG